MTPNAFIEMDSSLSRSLASWPSPAVGKSTPESSPRRLATDESSHVDLSFRPNVLASSSDSKPLTFITSQSLSLMFRSVLGRQNHLMALNLEPILLLIEMQFLLESKAKTHAAGHRDVTFLD